MMEVEYKRWGIFRSKLVYFGNQLPLTAGYHFVILEYCLSNLSYHPTFIRILETMLLIHDERTVKAFYQARDENIEDRKILNHLGSVVQWEILMHFKRLGYHTFDFGSLLVHPAIQYYKLSFGGRVIPVCDYKAALTPTAQAMLKIMKIMERKLRKFAHSSL